MKNKISIRTLTTLSLLLATEILLSRFLSLSTPIMKIGFSFIPIAITARYYGAVASLSVAAIGDLLGALLFPIGAYFPGYTLTAAIRGFITGAFLRKGASVAKISTMTLITEILCTVMLNTYWISITYGTSFTVLLPTRIIQAVILTIVQISTLWLLLIKGEKGFNKIFELRQI